MADCRNHGTGKRTQNNAKSNPPPVFNRSLTASAAAEEHKPAYSTCSSHAFQRNGSVKSLHGSTVSAGNSCKGKVRKLCSIFEPRKNNSSVSVDSQSTPFPSPKSSKPNIFFPTPSDSSNSIPKCLAFSVLENRIRLPGTEDRVVIYFTSLRGIRKTFQDCQNIRLVFRGFRVKLDERDVSMDVAYREELEKLLGQKKMSLPQVFIKGKYVGGAELVNQLVEYGEAAKMIRGLPLRSTKPCEGCDDVRFVPCSNCSGSHKLFDEDEEQTVRCPECNENGLVRCPLCCS